MSNNDDSGNVLQDSYKIPKKTNTETNNQDNNVIYTTPLNYTEIHNWDTSGINNRNKSWSREQSKAMIQPPYAIPSPYTTPQRPVEKEVPKNIIKTGRPFRETIPDLSDETLPKELKQMFQPLFCKLCQSHLNSNINAMHHYKSKNHEKKVRKFLIDYSEKTGEPLHKKAKMKIENEKEELDPKYQYCEVCDLQLTSKMHAEQHYMGRNHQKALVNKKPHGSGYYDEDGKFHRTVKVQEDPSGRHGIGLSFVTPEELEKKKSSPGKYVCTTCNITTTSSEHLEMHFNGQKHQKMLKKMAGLTYDPKAGDNLDLYGNPSEEPERKSGLLSCRTPSGQYYCQCCNITLNSQAQYMQHLDSKRHMKNKNNQNKKTETSVTNILSST